MNHPRWSAHYISNSNGNVVKTADIGAGNGLRASRHCTLFQCSFCCRLKSQNKRNVSLENDVQSRKKKCGNRIKTSRGRRVPGGGNDEQDGNSIRGVDVLQVLKRVQNDSSLSLPQRLHFVLSLVSSPEFLLPIPFSKKAEWLPCSSSNKRNRGRMEVEEK